MGRRARRAALGFALCVLALAAGGPTARAAAADREPAWSYEVTVGPDARELTVEARLRPGSPAELSVDDGAEPFVRDVEVEERGRFRKLSPRDGSWLAPACARAGCRLRYRFELARAADALESEVAGHLGGAIQASPASWLLHPIGEPSDFLDGKRYRFHVSCPPGVAFASGVHAASAPDTYEADARYLQDAPYSAFGALRRRTITSRSGGTVELAIAPGRRVLSDAELAGWVQLAADAVGAYYGRIPIDRTLVLVGGQPGHEPHGRTLGYGGASILLYVGDQMTASEIADDWVLPHELVHTAFPSMPRQKTWIEEGLATYVEPIARARVGQFSDERVWSELWKGLPNGLPERGDRGLDHTPTWGRIYWGGALYCLLADIEIRERSGGARSLDTALRAIVQAGGTIDSRWSLEAALAVGDRALGMPVLTGLYRKMGARPMPVDLGALFQRLGVRMDRGHVVLDDHAPLAPIRHAITRAAPRRRSRAPSTRCRPSARSRAAAPAGRARRGSGTPGARS